MALLRAIIEWFLGLFRRSPPAQPPAAPPPPAPVVPDPVDVKRIEKRWDDSPDPGNDLVDRRRRKP